MAGDKNGSNFAAMPRASIFYTGESTEEKDIERKGGPLILIFLVEMEAFIVKKASDIPVPSRDVTHQS